MIELKNIIFEVKEQGEVKRIIDNVSCVFDDNCIVGCCFDDRWHWFVFGGSDSYICHGDLASDGSITDGRIGRRHSAGNLCGTSATNQGNPQ